MSIEVRIPTILRPYTKDQKTVEAEGSTLSAVISNLDAQYAVLASDFLKTVRCDALSTFTSTMKMFASLEV
jgi:molybdopterin converting factor small subunit